MSKTLEKTVNLKTLISETKLGKPKNSLHLNLFGNKISSKNLILLFTFQKTPLKLTFFFILQSKWDGNEVEKRVNHQLRETLNLENKKNPLKKCKNNPMNEILYQARRL